VGRHSDAIDVTGPIDMRGLDGKRRNPALLVIAVVIIVAAVAIALLLLAS
jgi:hypothetical protein